MEGVIEVSGLERRFGSFKAVDGIDLHVERGEAFGLLGPNGAGKTTTMHMLTTLLAPTAGNARVCGFDVMKQPAEVRKRVGYVMQKLFTTRYFLTGRECVEMEASLYHVPRKEVRKRAEEVLDLVGLLGHADRRFNLYSGGMQKRLDLACGLLNHPEVLILDEPTLGLDVQSRHRIWEHIGILRDGGVTVLLATNYLDEADRLCGRIAIIDHGKVVVTGAPEDLKRDVGADVVQVAAAATSELQAALEGQPWVKRLAAPGSGELLVYVADASFAIPALMRIATEHAIHLDRVTYNQPTLDDVFLLHTGRELREAEVSA